MTDKQTLAALHSYLTESLLVEKTLHDEAAKELIWLVEKNADKNHQGVEVESMIAHDARLTLIQDLLHRFFIEGSL